MSATKLRMIFVGGSGRSGTSFVHTALGSHPEVATFLQVELKIMSSYGGLIDLFRTLTDDYGPGRATEVLNHFDRVTERLVAGGFGQRKLGNSRAGELLRDGFARFRARLVDQGHPRRMEPAEFFRHAQVLIEALTAAALADKETTDSPAVPRVLLEKTPHNLLFVGFLSQMAPGSAFLHVMRDPRAVAVSVQQMAWGPETLAGAAEWVRSYCETWARVRRQADNQALPVMEIFIEDVARDPEPHARAVCRHFGLEERPRLFSHVRSETLDRRLAEISPAERQLLDNGLGDTAVALGYDRETIGSRKEPAIIGTIPAEGLAAGA